MQGVRKPQKIHRGWGRQAVWAACVTIVTALLGGGATATPPRPLDPAFAEVVHEEIKVSSPFLLGAMVGDALQSVRRDAIFVWLPATEATRLCVHVRAIDGVYEASRRYDIEATEPGRYILPFAVREVERVAAYGAGELVLDARIGNDCGAPRDLRFLPSAWHGSPRRDALLLFVNADRNEAKVIVPRKAAEDAPVVFDCQPLPIGKRQRRYDRYCPVEGLGALDLTRAKLRLFRFGEPLGAPRDLGLVAPLGY